MSFYWIRISNLDDDFGPIPNSTAHLSWQPRFLYNFDLFLIKIDQFGYIFDLLIEIKSKMIDWKIEIVNLKIKNIKISWKSKYFLTFLIYFEQFWYKIDFFRLISNFLFKSWLVLINFVSTTDFESKIWIQNVDKKAI